MEAHRIDLAVYRAVGVSHQLSNLWHYMSIYVNVQRGMVRLQVPLKIAQTEFVPIFVFAIILGEFLHRVVRQVDILIVHILYIKFLAARTDVGVFVEITLEEPVYRGQHTVAAEVELPGMDQQRVINVALNNES